MRKCSEVDTVLASNKQYADCMDGARVYLGNALENHVSAKATPLHLFHSCSHGHFAIFEALNMPEDYSTVWS